MAAFIKKKIGFIQAKIKPPIYDKIRYVRALVRITIYINFK